MNSSGTSCVPADRNCLISFFTTGTEARTGVDRADFCDDPEFTALGARHYVGVPTGAVIVVAHPSLGELHFEKTSRLLASAPHINGQDLLVPGETAS